MPRPLTPSTDRRRRRGRSAGGARRLLPALGGALLLVAGLAVPAAAGERLLSDGPGDVWVGKVTEQRVVDPSVRQGDVLRSRLTYQRDHLTMHSVYREVRRSGRYAGYRLVLATGSGRYREVLLEAAPGHWRGTVRVFRRDGSRVGCGTHSSIDYAANDVTISVSRSCLGGAGKVHARVDSWWADDRSRFHVDNPHNAAESSGAWTGWVSYGRG